MKNFGIILTVIVLTLSLCACGRRDDTPTETTPATAEPTAAATIPTIDPTMGTNIPDPSVDSTMPDMIDPSENTSGNENSANPGDQSGTNSGEQNGTNAKQGSGFNQGIQSGK